MKTATRPDFFNVPSLKVHEELDKKGVSDEEQAYYGMSQTKGWQQFTDLASKLMEELDQINDNGVATGMSYEELGKNTIVISLTKGIIKKLLNKVEDAREQCEQSGK